MKKKLIAALIVIILGLTSIVVLILSKKNTILICELPNKTDNYTETLKFFFRNNAIEKFYRIEKLHENDKEKIKEEEKKFIEIKESIKYDLGTFVKYYSEKSDNEFVITTYIYVPRATEFFDHYFETKEIHFFMNLEMVKESLEEESYSCTLKE